MLTNTPAGHRKYGTELVLDLHGCNIDRFSRKDIGLFLKDLCGVISMEPHGDPHFWEDRSGNPRLHGVSAFQFISTSNIVVHALDMLHAVYLNVFSCRDFNIEAATEFSKLFFGAQAVRINVIERH